MMTLIVNIIAVLIVFAPSATTAENRTVPLTVEPSRCIALQQGQTCFAELQFQWDTPAQGDYCLYDNRKLTALICWQGNSVSSYQHSFSAYKNVNYELRSRSTDQALAHAVVKVSWVYKSNTSSTSRWRLF